MERRGWRRERRRGRGGEGEEERERRRGRGGEGEEERGREGER
jgi:hypothetical protein